MPDDPKINAKNDPAADFIQKEIERTRNNLHYAVNNLGHCALKAANPVPLFKRHPVKAGIVTIAALAGGVLCMVHAFRRKADTRCVQEPPVNVYVKQPKQRSSGWGQLGSALVVALTAKASREIRTAITNSFSDTYRASARSQTASQPNPNLRDVEI